MSKLVRDAKSSGQEIWYITAPASVPLSALKQVNLRDVAQGQAVLTYKEQQYAFVEDKEGTADSTRILIPEEDGMQVGILNAQVEIPFTPKLIMV
jgi:DNA-directed RNA polymerase I subunit RPA34.5